MGFDPQTGAVFATSGKDGKVKLWDKSYNIVRTLDVTALCQVKLLDEFGRPRVSEVLDTPSSP